MKVQERKIGKYKQLWVSLPTKICEAMEIEKGTELDIRVSGKNRLEVRIANKKTTNNKKKSKKGSARVKELFPKSKKGRTRIEELFP